MTLWKKVLWIVGSFFYLTVGVYFVKYGMPFLLGIPTEFYTRLLSGGIAPIVSLLIIIAWPIFLIEIIMAYYIVPYLAHCFAWIFSHI